MIKLNQCLELKRIRIRKTTTKEQTEKPRKIKITSLAKMDHAVPKIAPNKSKGTSYKEHSAEKTFFLNVIIVSIADHLLFSKNACDKFW